MTLGGTIFGPTENNLHLVNRYMDANRMDIYFK